MGDGEERQSRGGGEEKGRNASAVVAREEKRREEKTKRGGLKIVNRSCGENCRVTQRCPLTSLFRSPNRKHQFNHVGVVVAG